MGGYRSRNSELLSHPSPTHPSLLPLTTHPLTPHSLPLTTHPLTPHSSLSPLTHSPLTPPSHHSPTHPSLLPLTLTFFPRDTKSSMSQAVVIPCCCTLCLGPQLLSHAIVERTSSLLQYTSTTILWKVCFVGANFHGQKITHIHDCI